MSTKKTQKKETPAPKAPAATTTSDDGDKALTFRPATPEELENVPAKGSSTRGLQVQILSAIKDLKVRGGIVVDEEFKRVRRVISRINLKKQVPGSHFYVREYDGKIFVVRES